MPRVVEVVDENALGPSVEAVHSLVSLVLEAEEAEGVVVVAFVSEPEMAALNSRFRKIAEPTDVLSFPSTGGEEGEWPTQEPAREEEEENESAPELGDIVICPAVVQRYTAEDGTSLDWQLAWTLVHGVLHILGYDHEVDSGEMRKREQQLLSALAGRTPLLSDKSAG